MEGHLSSALCLPSPEAYADGVPAQDFPVKAAGRRGQPSVIEKELGP
jgi:hypothetical protein